MEMYCIGWKEVRFGYAIDSFIIIDGWCRGEFGEKF